MLYDDTPLLLLDATNLHIIGGGTYKFEHISFDEVKDLIEIFSEINDVAKCYSDNMIDVLLQERVSPGCFDMPHIEVQEIKLTQNAIVFKKSSAVGNPCFKTAENSSYTCEIITRIA